MTTATTLPAKAFGKAVMTSGFMHHYGIEHARMLASVLLQKLYVNDWGKLDEHDQQVNADVIEAGEGRIMAEYKVVDQRIWLISYIQTDAKLQADPNYCNTTIMFPSEY